MDDKPFDSSWDSVESAPRMRPIKPGNYQCSVGSVVYSKAKTGSEGVAIQFVMDGGEYAGMAVPLLYRYAKGAKITPQGLSIAKRDLEMLGFTSFEQIHNPPTVDPARRFIVTIARGDENPLGEVFTFNPA